MSPLAQADRMLRRAFIVTALLATMLLIAVLSARAEWLPVREVPFMRRPYAEMVDGAWTGRGVAYGMHRDGQRPGGKSPSRREIAEDLALIARHWSSLRVYGTLESTPLVLDEIAKSYPHVGVILGVWLDPEADSTAGALRRHPEAVRANRAQIEGAVRLARRYPKQVRGIAAGNETQVSWSGHRIAPAQLIAAIRELRARTNEPVTTADDYNFWNKPESEAVARECDFLMVHAHPLWNGQTTEQAIPWTEARLAEIRALHEGAPLVLGETGWATQRADVGDEAKYMKAESNEAAQAAFMDALEAWIATKPLPVFVFEAFDENWKGGTRPDEVEKHWGLYRADRTPKQAIARAR